MLRGRSVIHDETYLCQNNKNNLYPDGCILSIIDAIEHCNNDPTCGGFDITSNGAWQAMNSRQGVPAVQLFERYGSVRANGEWNSFHKL